MFAHQILGHEAHRRALRELLRKKQMAHALLFQGPRGIGKRQVALELAMAMLCISENKERLSYGIACGVCRNCRRVQANLHPDVLCVQPNEKGHILIQEIRKLIERAALKPYEAECKVYVVDNAESLNADAQNALLKLLEEPPVNVYFILIAEEVDKLLPTIRSRCQQMRFHPLSTEQVRAVLSADSEEGIQDAGPLAARLKGSLARARDLRDGNWLATEEEMFNIVENIISSKTSEFPDWAGLDAQTIRFRFDVLIEIFRDAYLRRLSVVGFEGMSDRSNQVNRIAQWFSRDEIENILETLGLSCSQLEQSIHPKLILLNLWQSMGMKVFS